MAEHWFISGANRGIGHGLATLLAARGDDVTASVRSDEAREQSAEDVARHRARFAIVSFDTRDEDAIRAAANELAEPIDVLVCNAGAYGPQRQSTLDMDFPGALDLFDVNTLGPLRLVQALLPHLRAENPRIALISSGLGSMATAGSTNIAYRAAKAALNKIAQGLGHDLKRERRHRRRAQSRLGAHRHGRQKRRAFGRGERERDHRDDRRADAGRQRPLRRLSRRGHVLVRPAHRSGRDDIAPASPIAHLPPSCSQPIAEIFARARIDDGEGRRDRDARRRADRRGGAGRHLADAARRRRSAYRRAAGRRARRAPIARTTSGDCANVPWPSGSLDVTSARSTTEDAALGEQSCDRARAAGSIAAEPDLVAPHPARGGQRLVIARDEQREQRATLVDLGDLPREHVEIDVRRGQHDILDLAAARPLSRIAICRSASSVTQLPMECARIEISPTDGSSRQRLRSTASSASRE